MLLRNAFFYTTGIIFLALAKAKNILKGYSSPKPFNMSELERCIEYDIRVVDEWLSYLSSYTQNDRALEGKHVLELGPGSDLGIGLYLLSKGCRKYSACDVNNLIESTPDKFYEQLLQKIAALDNQANINHLKAHLDSAKAGKPSQLNYVLRDDFDLVTAFGPETVDIVFSQAAFEHFDDIETTIAQLAAVCKPNAVLVLEIDLRTHSRWITPKDPNNIYRYSDTLYNIFKFRGSPNRVRPHQYIEAFKQNGWQDIELIPGVQVGAHQDSYSGMNKQFSGLRNQMDYLTIKICARKQTASNASQKEAASSLSAVGR